MAKKTKGRQESPAPSKQMIKEALKGLYAFLPGRHETSEAEKKLEQEYEVLHSKLLNNAKLKALAKKLDTLRKAEQKKKDILSNRIRRAQAAFNAYGLSRKVLTYIQKLTDELTSMKS